MNNFIKGVIEEKFASQAQQGLFFAKAKHSKKFKKMAKEFADKTDFSKPLPKYANKKKQKSESELTMKPEGEVDEIVDDEGNIISGDEPGNPNEYIRSKKTTDQVAKAAMGQMGSFGILGGATGANKTLKYWAESDQSKALGNEIKNDSDKSYEEAEEYFEDELEVPEDEAKDRVKKMGFDPELPDGKMRLIENPLKYIEEYLTKKGKDSDLVKKTPYEQNKKPVNDLIVRQLKSIKSSMKSNDLSINDVIQYLEDNE